MKKYKLLKLFLLLVILLISYIYAIVIGYIPDRIVLFEGEEIDLPSILGLSFRGNSNEELVEVSSTTSQKISEEVGVSKMQVSLFNNFLVKSVDVDVLPRTTVIPVGNLAGVKLYKWGFSCRYVRNTG